MFVELDELLELLCGLPEEVLVELDELPELSCGLLEKVLVELDGSLSDKLSLSFDAPVLSELLSSGSPLCEITADEPYDPSEPSEGMSRCSGTGPQPVISRQARIRANVFFIYCPFPSLFFNYTR